MRNLVRASSVLVALTLVTLTVTSESKQPISGQNKSEVRTVQTGRISEQVRSDDILDRVKFLEEQVQHHANLELVLADKLQATLNQLSTTAAILAQIAEGQKWVSDQQEQKNRDAKQNQQSADSTALGILGVVLALAGVGFAGLGFVEYKALRYKLETDLHAKLEADLRAKLEADLRALNRRDIDEARDKAAALSYTQIAAAYSRCYAKVPKNDPLFKVAVDLAVSFAEGTYVAAERLKELWDDDERKGRGKSKLEAKQNTALYEVARQNLARQLAIQALVTGNTTSAERVKRLTIGLKEFVETCKRREQPYDYWYDIEETLIVVDGVFGDPPTKTAAQERLCSLLQNPDLPAEWRDEAKLEYKNIDFLQPLPC